MKSKTVIDTAKELVESIGKEEAIKVFEKRIAEYGTPKDFETICKISGLKTAIEYINGLK